MSSILRNNDIPPPANPSENRLGKRLIQAWQAAKPDMGIPTQQQIFQQFIGDIWDYMFIFTVDPSWDYPCLQDAGGYILTDMGLENASHQSIADLPFKSLIAQSTINYDVVIAKMAPSETTGEYLDDNGNIQLFRSTLVPLSHEGTMVSSIIGVASKRTVG